MTSWSCPGTVSRPASARSGPQTRSCSTCCAEAGPRRRCGGCEMARAPPLSGFPELLPAKRLAETEVLATVASTFELHGFAPLETRAVEPLEQLLRKGDTSKEVYVLRRLQAGPEDTEDAAPGL